MKITKKNSAQCYCPYYLQSIFIYVSSIAILNLLQV